MDIKGFLANGESAEVNIDALGRINSKLFSMSDYSWKVETDFFIMKPKLAEGIKPTACEILKLVAKHCDLFGHLSVFFFTWRCFNDLFV